MSDKKLIMGVHANYSAVGKSDLIMIKEKVTEDGVTNNRIRYIENFIRDFYVTKAKFRNHKSKKEWEKISRCTRYKSNQVQLIPKVARAINKSPNSLRRLNRSPYLYGTDIHATTLALHKYREVYGSPTVLPTVGIMDYEWDIATESPSIGTYIFEDTIFLTVRKDKLKKMSVNEYTDKIRTGAVTHIKPLLDKYYEEKGIKVEEQIKLNIKVDVVENELEVITKLFSYTHTTQPDYLAFWNGVADFKVIERIAAKYFVDLKTFLNDPEVPEKYRHSEFVVGPTETIDANGKPKTKRPHEQWHILDNMASWQYIDLMGVYAHNRAHKPQAPSYAMDAILTKEIGLGKLKFESLHPELENLDPVKWHDVMSDQHIVEYSLYAIFDVIGPMLLEHKSLEIRGQAYSNIAYNPLGEFKKNPRRNCNKMHFSLLKKGQIIGSTCDKMVEEYDELIYPSNNWIVTLNSSYHDGLMTPALTDSNQPTLYVPHDADGDLTSSYPTNQRILNTSKWTTITEMIDGGKIPLGTIKNLGLSLSANGDSSIDFAVRAFDLPHLDQIVESYNISKG